MINLGYRESEINNAFTDLELDSLKVNNDLEEDILTKNLDFDGLFRETLLRINTEARNNAT